VQFLTFNKLDYKLNPDLTLLVKYRYSKTVDRDQDSVEARLDERSIGIAYRPVHNDRFNALARYTRLFEMRPLARGVMDSPEDLLSVVSIEAVYRFNARWEWVGKGAMTDRRRKIGDRPDIDSDTRLLIQRVNYNVWNRFDLGVEYRNLHQPQTDDTRQGWLGEGMWRLHRHFRLGAGYNFTDFSDNEFSANDYSSQGWFFRIQGTY